MRLICAGDYRSGKTKMLDELARRLRNRDIPVVYLRGRQCVSPQPYDLVGELARACGYNRARIEHAVILVDDIDSLNPQPGMANSGLYIGLLPVFEGRNVSYGKYLDQASLADIDVVGTATWQSYSRGLVRIDNRKSRRLVLPEMIADCFRVINIESLDKAGAQIAAENEHETAKEERHERQEKQR